MVYLFIIGFVIGLVFCGIYSKRLNGVEGDSTFLHWVEHYHWTEGFLIIYKRLYNFFFLGLAVGFILDELFQKKPFAYGKPHFLESTVIGVTLLPILFCI